VIAPKAQAVAQRELIADPARGLPPQLMGWSGPGASMADCTATVRRAVRWLAGPPGCDTAVSRDGQSRAFAQDLQDLPVYDGCPKPPPGDGVGPGQAGT
jgi:hypothetical protein